MHVVVFEGPEWQALAPLTFCRPTFELFCGMSTLLKKQIEALRPTRLTLWVRPQLVDYCRRHVVPSIEPSILSQAPLINEPLDSEPALLVDGSTLWLAAPSAAALSPSVAVDEGTSRIRQAVAVVPGLSASDALEVSPRWRALLDLPPTPAVGKSLSHLWDLLGFNQEALLHEAAAFRSQPLLANAAVHLVNQDRVLIGQDVRLDPGCVIDASKGPVVLSRGSVVGANAVVQGPCFIGEHTEISPLALIRPGTSIGPRCKIGGEVSRTIVVGHSNKAHEGFVGDSYLGEWVNLGAGTTTSNLKNTYGSIGMNLGGDEIDTGRRFLGSLIGDHTKTGIGTRFMSGSYVGYCAMIATSAHAPRLTPSFSFLTDKGKEPYRIEKAFEVAKAMFARRNRPWSREDESMMRYAADAGRQVEGSGSVAVLPQA